MFFFSHHYLMGHDELKLYNLEYFFMKKKKNYPKYDVLKILRVTMLFNEVVEVIVVSTDKSERVREGMEEDFFEWLDGADTNCW